MQRTHSGLKELDVDELLVGLDFGDGNEGRHGEGGKEQLGESETDEKDLLGDILSGSGEGDGLSDFGEEDALGRDKMRRRDLVALEELRERMENVERENTFLSLEFDALKKIVKKEGVEEREGDLRRENEALKNKYALLKKKFVVVSEKLLALLAKKKK